ncbi:MAG TPA: hypothetical protein G4N94_11230, partial [Caldilineae bacterium]|nr:hypothetical protein [Caldilineae bacterium]
MAESFRKNKTRWIALIILALLFVLAFQGMSTKNATVTVLRGLSVAAVTFLVASGFSIILGLMDVLNLAHGTLFMLGAYIGWTAYIRPDTLIDLATPFLLLIAGLFLMPLLQASLSRTRSGSRSVRAWSWGSLLLAAIVLFFSLSSVPIAIWRPEVYQNSPIVWTQAFETGEIAQMVQAAGFVDASPVLVWGGVLIGGILLAASIVGFSGRRGGTVTLTPRARTRAIIVFATTVVAGLVIYFVNTPLSDWLLSLDTIWLFVWAILVATLSGAGLGALMETTLIRPLYERPIYQIMLTFGLAFIGAEIVRSIWGRSGFTMPRPSLFAN